MDKKIGHKVHGLITKSSFFFFLQGPFRKASASPAGSEFRGQTSTVGGGVGPKGTAEHPENPAVLVFVQLSLVCVRWDCSPGGAALL